MNSGEARRLQSEYLYPNIKTYYSEPLLLVEGQGTRLRDAEGNQYLDFFGGILTVSVGHCHPHVSQAITDQAQRLVHTSTCYLTTPLLEMSRRLAEITPGRLQKCFFTNSGTEAIETALNTARIYTGADEIIALRHSYHGRSSLATAVTGNAGWRTPGSNLPGVVYAHNGYCYRCSLGQTYPDCGVACAYDIEEVIRTTTSGRVAALVAEPIQGVGGFITPPPEYFRIVVEIVREYGGIFIADEVQTGFGRTGEHMFGIEHWGVEPDIMVFAKGLANGSPVGATIAVPEVADACSTQSISTFGGNPVSMAAASATLDVILDSGLPDHVHRMGEIVMEGCRDMMDRYPFLGEVRGKGLMVGAELVNEDRSPAPDLAGDAMEAARLQGLLVGKGGLYGNVLRLTPPMNIEQAELEEALDKLDRAFSSLA